MIDEVALSGRQGSSVDRWSTFVDRRGEKRSLSTDVLHIPQNIPCRARVAQHRASRPNHPDRLPPRLRRRCPTQDRRQA